MTAPTPVELTAKKWKAMQLIGVALLKDHLLSLCAGLVFTSVAYAAPQPFEIKGLTLGRREAEACGEAEVRSQQRLFEQAGGSGVELPATSCEIRVGSVAGVKVDGPARLLFWHGRLIRLVIEFGRLELDDFAALRSSLSELHGKPRAVRQAPFNTDTWSASSSSMELERTDRFPTTTTLYLTEPKGWSEYLKSRKRASQVLETIERQRRREDVRGKTQ